MVVLTGDVTIRNASTLCAFEQTFEFLSAIGTAFVVVVAAVVVATSCNLFGFLYMCEDGRNRIIEMMRNCKRILKMAEFEIIK